MQPAREVTIRIDQDEARRLGLSSQAVAAVLNTNISGSTLTQVRDDIFLVDVVAREVGGQTLSTGSLQTLPVALPTAAPCR
jgi:multidrug efflux pump subunit AcrB